MRKRKKQKQITTIYKELLSLKESVFVSLVKSDLICFAPNYNIYLMMTILIETPHSREQLLVTEAKESSG